MLAAVVAGCAMSKKLTRPFSRELQIEVYVDQDLNQNSALAVDLVVLYNKDLAEEVMEKSARDWFAGKEQFERDHPKGKEVFPWEWVPGQQVPTLTVRIKGGAHKAVLFADYLAPGQHREQLDLREHIVLRLGRRGFEVKPQTG